MGITKLTARKILKDAGAVRVSDSAADELSEILNKLAYAMAGKAVKLAAHAKRQTVKKADIELAR
jgi:histone H3/H4